MWKVRQNLNSYENVRLKDELQKMQYLYNDYIEVQKLYYIKVTIVFIIIGSDLFTVGDPHDNTPSGKEGARSKDRNLMH